MGSTGNTATIPRTSVAKDLHLLKILVYFREVPGALDARTVDLSLSINDETSRENWRDVAQKSVLKMSAKE